MRAWLFSLAVIMAAILAAMHAMSSAAYPAYTAYAESSSYILDVNGEEYDISYEVEADMLAMQIDYEQRSLLVGIEDAQDSMFTIRLPDSLISAPDNEFAVLVDQVEVGYTIADSRPGADVVTLMFYIPQYSQEVEIIGTHVIPEFPVPVMMIILAAGLVVTVAARARVTGMYQAT